MFRNRLRGRSGHCAECLVDPPRKIVPHAAVPGKYFRISARGKVGVKKSLVDRGTGIGDDRADPVCIVAEGHRDIKVTPLDFIERL
jgi:hypothetical protein